MSIDDDEDVDIICTFKAITDKAVLVEIDGVDGWIPRSQILDADEDLDTLARGDIVTLTITKWIAEQKELI